MFKLRNRNFINKFSRQEIILIPVEQKTNNNCLYCNKLIDAPRKHALGLVQAVDYQIAIPITSNHNIKLNGVTISNSSDKFGCSKCLTKKGVLDLAKQGYIQAETQKIEGDVFKNKQLEN